MPKLHLKRTPAEEEERAQRKARKAKRKEAKRAGQKYDLNGSSSTSTRDNYHRSKRRATDTGEDANYDTDYESDDRLQWLEEQQHRKQEEEEFQQRLWDELGQQERLDNLTSNLNSYPHIPQRWKSGGMALHSGCSIRGVRRVFWERFSQLAWRVCEDGCGLLRVELA